MSFFKSLSTFFGIFLRLGAGRLKESVDHTDKISDLDKAGVKDAIDEVVVEVEKEVAGDHEETCKK